MASKRKTADPQSTAKSTKATKRRPETQAELLPADEVTPPAETVAVPTMSATEAAQAQPLTEASISETPAAAVPSAPEPSCPNCQAATPQLRPSGYCSDWCEQEAACRESPHPPDDRRAGQVAGPVPQASPTEASAPPARPESVSAAAPKKLSAIDAAARVLAETGQPMNCQTLIQAMAEKGYWTSPAGRTPSATLYASLLKEITTKGEQSRFRKVDRGLFARND